MKLFRFYFISLTIIFLLAFCGVSISKISVTELNSHYGKADLSFLGESEIVALGGVWEYYKEALYEDILMNSKIEKKYVNVPHEWEPDLKYKGYPYGYATYATELVGLNPKKYYGIFIVDEYASYRLFINDKLIIDTGKVGRTKEEYVPEFRSKWGAFNSDEYGKAKIIIEIANFDYFRGGFWVNPRIGEFETIRNMAARNTSVEIILFVSTLIMGLFLLTLYAKMKSEKTALLMGIFASLVALRVLFTGYRIVATLIPGMSWSVMNRLEYIFGYLLLPVAGYMACSLAYVKQPKMIKNLYDGLLFIGVMLPLYTSNHVYAKYLYVYKYLTIVFAIYFLYILVMGICNKKSGAIPITIGYLFVVVGAFEELFFGSLSFFLGFATFIMVGILTLFQVTTFSSLKTQKESLESEIIKDKLTSVYNRFYLEMLMDNSIIEEIEGHRWYVLFVDIDNFKPINDTYGHHIGDLVLIKTAEILKKSVRDSGKVIRYGGDEFVIIASIDKTKAPQILQERIKSKLKEPFDILGNMIKISISIGTTEYQIGNESLREAILKSDEEMYDIKNRSV